MFEEDVGAVVVDVDHGWEVVDLQESEFGVWWGFSGQESDVARAGVAQVPELLARCCLGYAGVVQGLGVEEECADTHGLW
ncbi:hypothetical protein L6E12_04925 [Actinokineospora sp. PR83]|nr:hypothetical protein [Actinokineospora sp. PR83]MCG8915133.1 hypothetical protein [Actinokineospora sp. PR83]